MKTEITLEELFKMDDLHNRCLHTKATLTDDGDDTDVVGKLISSLREMNLITDEEMDIPCLLAVTYAYKRAFAIATEGQLGSLARRVANQNRVRLKAIVAAGGKVSSNPMTIPTDAKIIASSYYNLRKDLRNEFGLK